ncbi:Fasciclin-1 like protein [Argiope bruennichi]|uniref:Fasciclin-1 like protein n=1 Tax=Argiope bruennichi TaxID=94029 RepID=A0A8T0FPC5_ARGBR|nr:Fasciclin-1 like protein [Argiope bruennichi]
MVHFINFACAILFASLAHFVTSETLYEALSKDQELSEFYNMVNREEVLQILLDRRDVTVFAPINSALRKHKARKQEDPKRDESTPMPSFYVLNLSAQKHMFPMAITPYLAGVAPLYLSVKEEERKRKEYYVDNAKIIRQAEHRGTEGKTQFLYVIDELLEPYKPISGQPPTALELLKQPSIYGLKETIDAFASRVTSEREKEVFSRVGNHTFFLPIGSVDGASSSKLQEIDTWVSFKTRITPQ